MNQQLILLMGRATREREELSTKKGKLFNKFGLAINEYWKDEEDQAVFYDIACFNDQTKRMSENIEAGDAILVLGKPTSRAYETKEGELKSQISCNAYYLNVFKKPKTKDEDND